MKHKRLAIVYYPTNHLKKGVGFYGNAGVAAHLIRAEVWRAIPSEMSISVIVQVGDELKWPPGR